eukprot:TRINITY_DN17118_c0_g1_i1.p2 TRINITY_DN17118_c0_g1~~TRINITY_DN17118_c0_g1_i1.p2  ORF type:complete len:502 (-),score=99.90 TRINITY_DN17118_c0_g1_i1:2311-3816(-)
MQRSEKYALVCLADIKKDMQCPICLGIIRKTRTVMECLHRFCRECIDKAMRLGNNECPACRVHCASRRSLRADPMFDNIVAAIYPNLDKDEEEDTRLDEDECFRNRQIQERISEAFQRQSSVLLKRGSGGGRRGSITAPPTHQPSTSVPGVRVDNGRAAESIIRADEEAVESGENGGEQARGVVRLADGLGGDAKGEEDGGHPANGLNRSLLWVPGSVNREDDGRDQRNDDGNDDDRNDDGNDDVYNDEDRSFDSGEDEHERRRRGNGGVRHRALNDVLLGVGRKRVAAQQSGRLRGMHAGVLTRGEKEARLQQREDEMEEIAAMRRKRARAAALMEALHDSSEREINPEALEVHLSLQPLEASAGEGEAANVAGKYRALPPLANNRICCSAALTVHHLQKFLKGYLCGEMDEGDRLEVLLPTRAGREGASGQSEAASDGRLDAAQASLRFLAWEVLPPEVSLGDVARNRWQFRGTPVLLYRLTQKHSCDKAFIPSIGMAG